MGSVESSQLKSIRAKVKILTKINLRGDIFCYSINISVRKPKSLSVVLIFNILNKGQVYIAIYRVAMGTI